MKEKLDEKEMYRKIEKKIFTSKNFIEAQIWVYSVMAASSFAFFLSLLSSTKSGTLLYIATLLFSVSLGLNVFVAFLFSILKEDGELIHNINKTKIFSKIILFCYLSFILGVVCFIGVFSILAMVVFIIFLLILFFLYPKIQKEVENIENAEYEKEFRELEKKLKEI